MGQGFYTCVFFGSIYEPPACCDEDVWYDLVHDSAVPGTQAGMRYEASNPWFGYLVTDCGQGVSDSDDLPVISYEAFSLASLPRAILSEERFAKALAAAQESYRRLQVAARAKGLTVPPGELLLVNDYD